MTLYRWLVAVAWLTWMWALAAIAPIFDVWIRVGAALIVGSGFAQLWGAQRRLPKILEKTKR